MQRSVRAAIGGVPSARAPTVLLVEDEVLVRAATARFLRECGFTVLEAVQADDAIQMLAADPRIEAVFADVKLPGPRNGVDLAHLVRREYPNIKILLTSGVAPFPEVEGVTLLRKPYFLFDVEQRLKVLLGLLPARERRLD